MWMKCLAIDLYRDLFQVQFCCWDHVYSLHNSFWHLSTSLYFKVRLIHGLRKWCLRMCWKRKGLKSFMLCPLCFLSYVVLFRFTEESFFSFLFLWVSLPFPSLWPHSALAPLEHLTSWHTFLLNPPLSPCPQVPAVITFLHVSCYYFPYIHVALIPSSPTPSPFLSLWWTSKILVAAGLGSIPSVWSSGICPAAVIQSMSPLCFSASSRDLIILVAVGAAIFSQKGAMHWVSS